MEKKLRGMEPSKGEWLMRAFERLMLDGTDYQALFSKHYFIFTRHLQGVYYESHFKHWETGAQGS